MLHRWVLVAALASCTQGPTVDEDRAASVSVCAAGPTAKGVDVSAEVVDWPAFRAGGWDFAIAKASEGVTFVESRFAQNWKAMKAAGVVRGAYCFFHSSPDDPVVEADFFVDVVNQAGGYEPGDFLALDLEVLDGNTPDVVAADALAWLARVKETTGITPIIYTSPRVFDTLLGSPAGFSGYPLWDVTWNGGPPKCPNIPASWPGWAFWQYAGDSISAPGLPGSMNDGDVFNGSRADLVAFGLSLAGVAVADAGVTPPDGGMVPRADAGALVDAGVLVDGGGVLAADAGRGDAGAGGGGSGNLGSLGVTLTGGCSVGGESDAGPATALLALLLAGCCRERGRRRPRARSGPGGCDPTRGGDQRHGRGRRVNFSCDSLSSPSIGLSFSRPTMRRTSRPPRSRPRSRRGA